MSPCVSVSYGFPLNPTYELQYQVEVTGDCHFHGFFMSMEQWIGRMEGTRISMDGARGEGRFGIWWSTIVRRA